MVFAVSKLFATSLEKMRTFSEGKSLQDITEQINEKLNLLNRTTLDIAITGESGAGKSSLVNALRGMTDYEEGSAKIGAEGETTMEAKKYPHPTFPKVAIWDLPGIGTPNFKAEEYLKRTNFAEYDFFIIVAAERFVQNNVRLAKEIQKMNKRYYFVRNKVNLSIEAAKRSPDFSEKETLEKIRDYCCESLRKAGESNPRVFLLSCWNLGNYDFCLLQNTLENELGDLKRHLIIEAMSAYSKEALEKKKAVMRSLIWKVALKACAVGAIPLPGLSLVCDIQFLKETLKKFCQVFSLDEESLGRLARWAGKPVDELKSEIKKSPLESQITKRFVLDLAIKSTVSGIAIPVKLALKFIPVVGSLVGGAASFVTTFYMLQNFLNNVMEDAENVLAKALESKDA